MNLKEFEIVDGLEQLTQDYLTYMISAPSFDAERIDEMSDSQLRDMAFVLSVASIILYKPFKTMAIGKTSCTCSCHTTAGRYCGHDWYDKNRTAILASAPGKVISATFHFAWGWHVVVQHSSGHRTWYAHMAEKPSVSVGQMVNTGDYLGPMGTTGNSTGVHLHFGVELNGVWINPTTLLDKNKAAGEVNEEVANYYVERERWEKVKYLFIDVSRYQVGFDFFRAANNGVMASIARCSAGNANDSLFMANYEGAKAAGMLLGAYHYVDGSLSYEVQAKRIVSALSGYTLDFPVFLDVENGSSAGNTVKTLQLISNINTYLTRNLDGQISYSDAYYAWRDEMYNLYWSSYVDHKNRDYTGLYSSREWINKNVAKIPELAYLLGFFATWNGPEGAPLVPEEWRFWGIDQFGQGLPKDFGQDVDLGQWNPNLPIPTRGTTPPPPVGGIPIKVSANVSVKSNLEVSAEAQGVKYSGIVPLDSEFPINLDVEIVPKEE